MPPLVGLFVEFRREFAVGFGRDHRGNAARQHVGSQPVRIKSAVGQQMPGIQTLKQGAGLAQIVCLPRHQAEINEVAERIGQRQNLGGYPASGAPDGLAESPPFAPCPERWTLTIVPSVMAYSKSEFEDNALNML